MLQVFSTRSVSIIVLALLLGCGSSEEPAAPAVAASNATASVAEPSRAPVYSAPKQSAPVATPAGEPDFAAMNRELRRWILRNQRPPRDFEEFAASSGIQFPAPPAGKRYAIDKTMHVVIVKR